MSLERWHVEEADGVAVLTFIGGGTRTMPIAAMAELGSVMRGWATELEPPVVVLSLDVVHADLGEVLEMTSGRPIADFVPWVEAISAVEEHPMPVLAAVPRQATAGGCELALACDARILAPSARIGLFETRMGIIPGAGGTQRLHHLVGPGAAALLVYGGRAIDGKEAHRIGLADILDDDPVTAATELALAFRAQGVDVLVAAKRALTSARVMSLTDGLREEGRAFLSVVGKPLAAERLGLWHEHGEQ